MSTKSLALGLVLALVIARVNGSAFRYADEISCSEEIDIDVYAVGCNGGDTCYMGDVIDVYGKINLREDLKSPKLCVQTDLCFMDLGFLCKRYQRPNLNVCNMLGVSSANDGTPCPYAGEFFFNSHIEIPGQGAVGVGKGE